MSKALHGTWLTQGMSFFRDGKKVGYWPEAGIGVFDAKGHFCLMSQYQGADPSYPPEMLRFIASSGTYQVSDNKLITKFLCSSAENRINQTREYEFWFEGDELLIKGGIKGESWFVVHLKKPV